MTFWSGIVFPIFYHNNCLHLYWFHTLSANSMWFPFEHAIDNKAIDAVSYYNRYHCDYENLWRIHSIWMNRHILRTTCSSTHRSYPLLLFFFPRIQFQTSNINFRRSVWMTLRVIGAHEVTSHMPLMQHIGMIVLIRIMHMHAWQWISAVHTCRTNRNNKKNESVGGSKQKHEQQHMRIFHIGKTDSSFCCMSVQLMPRQQSVFTYSRRFLVEIIHVQSQEKMNLCMNRQRRCFYKSCNTYTGDVHNPSYARIVQMQRTCIKINVRSKIRHQNRSCNSNWLLQGPLLSYRPTFVPNLYTEMGMLSVRPTSFSIHQHAYWIVK